MAIALIDPGYAKQQLLLLVKDRFMHPNGQLPAYEWRFDDANPPVHAWASWRVYQQDKALTGVGDMDFLERIFHKLLLNFSWWVNRKDAEGRNLFQGGFLGLDNIALFDRSATLPPGYQLDQADGTSWVAAYALDLMRIGLELAKRNGVYVDIAVKFSSISSTSPAPSTASMTAPKACGMSRTSFSTTCCTALMVRANRCACAPSSG